MEWYRIAGAGIIVGVHDRRPVARDKKPSVTTRPTAPRPARRVPAGESGTLIALQRSAGNRAVAVTVQRAGEQLSVKDRAALSNAETQLNGAITQTRPAADALRKYANSAPKLFQSMKSTYEEGANRFIAAQNVINYKITTAKEIGAARDEALGALLGAATGPIGTQLVTAYAELGSIVDVVAHGREAMAFADKVMESSGALSALSNAMSDESVLDGGAGAVAGKATGAVGAAMKGKDAEGVSGAPDWANETAFYKAYSDLADKGLALVATATQLMGINGPINRVHQAIADTKIAGRALSIPISSLDKAAATLNDGSSRIAAAAPRINALLVELDKAVAQMIKALPPTADEAELDIWVQWISGLGAGERGILDEDYLEKYLEQKGVWKKLGIDRGQWFSDDERAVATASAKAQQRILAARGAEIEIKPDFGLSKADVPGIPYRLPVLGGKAPYGMRTVGIVAGARAVDPISTDVLKQTNSDFKSNVAEQLLLSGRIGVVVAEVRTESVKAGGE